MLINVGWEQSYAREPDPRRRLDVANRDGALGAPPRPHGPRVAVVTSA